MNELCQLKNVIIMSAQECDNHTEVIWQEGTFCDARKPEMMDAKLN